MLNKNDHKPRIFLCHANEDKPQVEELYQQLKEAGYHPWLDKYDLLPGQDWRREIRRIITDPYNLVVVCLSQKSITKRSMVQREIKWALDILDEMPEDAIYLIPACLESCQVPDRLAHLQWVNLFESDGFEKLKRALDAELDSRQTIGEVTQPCTESGIQIEYPQNGHTEYSNIVEVGGGYERVLPNQSLRLCVLVEGKYWPQRDIPKFNASDKKWSASVPLEEDKPGTKYDLLLLAVLVNEVRSEWWEQYYELGDVRGSVDPLEFLPPDIKVCDKIRIIKGSASDQENKDKSERPPIFAPTQKSRWKIN